MTQNQDKHIVTKLIEYFTAQKVIGLVYAEAIDPDTAVLLSVSITNNMEDGDKNIPAKRITALSCSKEDKQIITETLNYLNEMNTTGFDYHMDIPNAPQFQLDIHVRLNEMSIQTS